MIAILWLLVTSDSGNVLYGYITLGVTLINFFITPYVGKLIDRVSRKRLLIFSEILCLFVILLFALYGFTGHTYSIWHYTVIYIIGNLYYTIFYPTMFALNQEIFKKDQYKSLNGTMEVQGQLSSMIAGALASYLLVHWELQSILLLNVISYAAATYFYLRLPYIKNKRVKDVSNHQDDWSSLQYLKENPKLFVFLFFSTMPFLSVLISNYLFPVYLSDVMNTTGDIYALENMIYAIGAISAGMTIPIIAKKISNEVTVIAGVALYCIAISIIVFVPLPVFLTLSFFLALGNSGTRVARNSFMMDEIPNEIMGRVDGMLRTAGLLFRIIVIALFTKMISASLIIICFIILSGVMVIAALAVLFSVPGTKTILKI